MKKVLLLRHSNEGFKNSIQKNVKNIEGCFAFIDYIVPYALTYHTTFKRIDRKKDVLHKLYVDENTLVYGHNLKITGHSFCNNILYLKTNKIIKNKLMSDFIELPLKSFKENVDLVETLEKKYNTKCSEFNRSCLDIYMLNEIIIKI